MSQSEGLHGNPDQKPAFSQPDLGTPNVEAPETRAYFMTGDQVVTLGPNGGYEDDWKVSRQDLETGKVNLIRQGPWGPEFQTVDANSLKATQNDYEAQFNGERYKPL